MRFSVTVVARKMSRLFTSDQDELNDSTADNPTGFLDVGRCTLKSSMPGWSALDALIAVAADALSLTVRKRQSPAQDVETL